MVPLQAPDIPNLDSVHLTRRRLVAIGASLVVAATVGTVAIVAKSPTGLSALPRLQSPIGAVFHRPIELLGACEERRLDAGHDIDPNGLVDQENDECLPSQQASRTSSGRLNTVGTGRSS